MKDSRDTTRFPSKVLKNEKKVRLAAILRHLGQNFANRIRRKNENITKGSRDMTSFLQQLLENAKKRANYRGHFRQLQRNYAKDEECII